MITASNSQTSVSDNNLVETPFNNSVEPVEETEPGRSRSRAPHLIDWPIMNCQGTVLWISRRVYGCERPRKLISLGEGGMLFA